MLPYICLTFTFLLAVVMVSRVRYFAFKEYGFLKAHPFSYMVTAMLLFACIAAEPKLLGFLIMFIYLLSGPIYTIIFMPRRLPLLSEPFVKPNQKAESATNEAESAKLKDI
jgi:CDP-diacylglycerol--serine O-phosphatidyltransferase